MVGGWRRLVGVGGGWVAVGGGWRLVVLRGCPSGMSLTQKKNKELLRTALATPGTAPKPPAPPEAHSRGQGCP